jgi:uncharacterized protein (TIGR03000 family)
MSGGGSWHGGAPGGFHSAPSSSFRMAPSSSTFHMAPSSSTFRNTNSFRSTNFNNGSVHSTDFRHMNGNGVHNHDGNHNNHDFDHHHNDFDHHHGEFNHNNFFHNNFFGFGGGFGPWWGWWGPWCWGNSWGGGGWYNPWYSDSYAYGGYPSDYGSYNSGPTIYSDDTYQSQTPSGETYTDDNPRGGGPQVDENAALIAVQVPADAELWFNGTKMSGSTQVRQFQTPALEPGREYSYDVLARWTESGRAVERTRKVTVHAGDRLGLNFMAGTRSAAPVP